jgi:hypothetical protein
VTSRRASGITTVTLFLAGGGAGYVTAGIASVDGGYTYGKSVCHASISTAPVGRELRRHRPVPCLSA